MMQPHVISKAQTSQTRDKDMTLILRFFFFFFLPSPGGIKTFLHPDTRPGESAQAGKLHPRQLNVMPQLSFQSVTLYGVQLPRLLHNSILSNVSVEEVAA